RRKPWREDRARCGVDFVRGGTVGGGEEEFRSLAEYELMAIRGPGGVASGQVADSFRRAGVPRQSPEFAVNATLDRRHQQSRVVRGNIESLHVREGIGDDRPIDV